MKKSRCVLWAGKCSIS